MKLKTLIIFLLSQHILLGQSRLKIDEWQSHLPNKSCYSLAKANGMVYAGGKLTFFSYNVEKGSIRTLAKNISQYSQNSVAKVGYNEATSTLVIAYDNGMIDLQRNGQPVEYFHDIYKSNVIGSKNINHLYFYGSKLYISSDLGLIIYDLLKREVESICKTFTNSSTTTAARSSTIVNDTIYLATEVGLFKAAASSKVNKMDYRNWAYIPLPAPKIPLVYHVASIGNKLFAATRAQETLDTLLVYEQNQWVRDFSMEQLVGKRNFNGLVNNDGKLWIMQEGYLYQYDNSEYKLAAASINPFDVLVYDNSSLFIADAARGLVRINRANGAQLAIAPNAPSINFAFGLTAYEDKIIAVSGGYNYEYYGQWGRGEGYSVYKDGIWQNYKPMQGNVPFVLDMSSARYNPVNGHVLIASYGFGMLEWDQKDKFKLWNHKTPGCLLNSCPTCNEDPFQQNYCRVPDLAIDSKGTAWILNTPDPNVGRPGLFKYNTNGTWEGINWTGQDIWNSFGFYTPTATEPYFTHRIYIDRNDTKWIASRYYSLDPASSKGLFAYNESRSNLPRHFRYVKDRREDICGSQVYAIVEDKEGAIWIGTEGGVCYFPDANEVFQRKTVKATVPVYENKPLLKGVWITSIDVDENNRKWIGTYGKGVFLFNADGSKMIKHFDKTNSPLTTDIVNDVKVHKKTGEVFIATDEGIFSYGSDAIGLDKDGSAQIDIYPNPVRPDFNGQVVFSGFSKLSILKITDIAGNLVYQTKAEGNLVTWNVKDYNGVRPQTGVYLVYASKDDGTEAMVGKIAIID